MFSPPGTAGDNDSVIDVGGGTTDLTLIQSQSTDADDAESFRRIAVGPHLLLGGDNMDLLLAYEAERRIIGRNGSLNSKLMSQLVSNCWEMKEKSFFAQSRRQNLRAAQSVGADLSRARGTVDLVVLRL